MSASEIAKPGDDFAAAFGPLLEQMPAALKPIIEKAAGELYAATLDSVEEYIRNNVEWNIGSALDRGSFDGYHRYRLCGALSRLMAALVAPEVPDDELLTLFRRGGTFDADALAEAVIAARAAIAQAERRA